MRSSNELLKFSLLTVRLSEMKKFIVICSYLVSPQKSHPQFWDIGRAFADVLVMAHSKEQAQEVSFAYLERQHWQVQSVKSFLHPQKALIMVQIQVQWIQKMLQKPWK